MIVAALGPDQDGPLSLGPMRAPPRRTCFGSLLRVARAVDSSETSSADVLDERTAPAPPADAIHLGSLC
jgi:hypothetical protein